MRKKIIRLTDRKLNEAVKEATQKVLHEEEL